MSRRGGRGRYRYLRSEGRDSNDYRRYAEDGSAPSSSRDREGEGVRRGRGRGRPPGLRGRAIGLYYRDRMLNREQQTQALKQNIGVFLDSRKKQQIWELLNSCQGDKLEKISGWKSCSSNRYFSPFVSSASDNQQSYSEFCRRARLENSHEIKVEQGASGIDLFEDKYSMQNSHNMKVEPGTSDSNSFQDKYNSLENSHKIKAKSGTSDSDLFEDKYNSLENSHKMKVEPGTSDSDLFEEKYNSLENSHKMKVEPGTSAGDSFDDKYSHIGDSSFKRKFLQNITGNIETNIARSLLVRTALDRDEELDMLYKQELLSKNNNSHYQAMKEFRQKLPSYNMQCEILNLLEYNQVVVISGETGCGKTTQVAQFILDDYIMKNKGSTCHIVCTQPRRISATSVAARVADERNEVCGGSSVGYQIRLEKELPRRKGSILYCTTGILLQKMEGDPALREISHLVLDEIHERDVTCDFLLTILKDVIPKRPDLKVILMSATLNAEQFAKYFGNCPCINIPGFTFPVMEYYLEDVLEMTRFVMKPKPEPTAKWKKFTRFGKTKALKIEAFRDFIEPYIRNLQREGKYSSSVLEMLKNPDSEELNLDLTAALIQYIDRTNEDGAILVFLPGWDNISTLHKLLTESGRFPPSRYLIIPLHSMMPTVIQKSIFDRPSSGVRKIIIATNIAETSITIDDVVYVIDCGKIKMKNFDVENNVSTLKAEWVSLANSRQRRGRAGRVQPGECYHLYTRAREMTLDNYPLPEMLRTRLEEVILQLKILQLGKTKPFLERVMDPPDPRAVELSIKLLQNLNALDVDENLTPLGFHLARLPVDPQTGKMILMGALFSCVDPIFSVAASLSFKDAFHIPLGREEEVTKKKLELSMGQKSDHLVLAEALKQWEIAESMRSGHDFCWKFFLSSNTLRLLRDMKGQFAEHLCNMNFLRSNNPKAEDANINSENISLIKAIVCSGLYPNVAIIKSVKKKRGTVIVKLHTPEDGKVCIHPRSINEKQPEFESPFLLYHLKLKSSNIYLHDTTMVYPLPLLFFGKGINFDINEDTIEVDKSIRFRCEEETAYLVKELRKRLDQLLEYKITHPGTINWNSRSNEGAVLRAIIELITSEDKTMMLVAQDDAFSD